jgi:GNAT superfamily N-acetyltransferase
MTEEFMGTITTYTPSMAAKVAEMFSAFNEIWPVGFGGGIPYDEQRVRDWLDKTSAIIDLVALDTNGDPVGYCGLYPHRRDSHAAYISLLGVHPRVLGKKVGKNLLLKALAIAAEKGIQRVDLHTWAGNLRAMPLYKKVGLFWVPGTHVYMQDYLPGLLQIPLAQQWFSKHPDWYKWFKRELTQAPDMYDVDGMKVYTYTFEAGGDRLSADVDRYGWHFSGIERVIDDTRVAVKTRLASHDMFIGIPNALTIQIINETGEDIETTVTVEPFKGVEFAEQFPHSVRVPNGEPVEITRKFVVNRSAHVFKTDDVASDVIKSTITVTDEPIELYTGGKIRPAVTIASQDLYKMAPPGKETVVYLDVINNTEKQLTGTIDVRTKEGEEIKKTVEITLSPHEVAGVEIPVYVPADAQSVPVHCTPSLDIDNATWIMPSYQYAVVADRKDVTAVVGKDGEKTVVVTDYLAVYIEHERGRITISPLHQHESGERINFDIGPPFGLSLDQTLTFDCELVADGKYITAVLTGNSIHIPGIQIRKYVRVAAGMHEVEYWVTLMNIDAEKPLHAAGKLSLSEGKGISIRPLDVKKRVFIPVRGILESDPSTNFVSDNMVPQNPEAWEESWTAAEHMNKNDFSGWIWNQENIRKIKVAAGSLQTLESTTHVLAPGEVYEPVHLWYTFSHSSLSDIQRRWSQLVGRKEISADVYAQPQTLSPLAVELSGEHILEKGVKATRTLHLQFATAYPFAGELYMNLPPGWEGYFVTEDGKSEKIAMPEPVPGGSVPLVVELSVPDCIDASAVVHLHLSGEFELDFDVPFLLTGDKDVLVAPKDIDGHEVLEVSNGVVTFDVVTEVGGNLIRLQDAQGHTFFDDNYPEIKPKVVVSYNIGGIQPAIFPPELDNPFFEPEQVEAEIVEEGLWRGVSVSWTVLNQELLRGQIYALTYLTLPGSPVVRIRLEHTNPTRRLVRWAALLVADLQLQGSLDDTILTAPGGVHPWVRNRVKNPFISLSSQDNPWVKASKGDQSLLFFVPEGHAGTAVVVDLIEMMAGLLLTLRETGPEGKTAVEFAFAVGQSEGKVKELKKALAK